MDAHSNPRGALKSAQEQDQRWRRNERDRARCAAETAEQRSKRFRNRREMDRPGAAQTASERQATSQHISTCGHERIAAETPEERERRLQRMRTNQPERLAVETPKERELRLECYSTRYIEQESVQPQLFQQCSIRAKTQKFHATWPHWKYRYAPLVHKHFQDSISTLSLMYVCVVVATSTFRSYNVP